MRAHGGSPFNFVIHRKQKSKALFDRRLVKLTMIRLVAYVLSKTADLNLMSV